MQKRISIRCCDTLKKYSFCITLIHVGFFAIGRAAVLARHPLQVKGLYQAPLSHQVLGFISYQAAIAPEGSYAPNLCGSGRAGRGQWPMSNSVAADKAVAQDPYKGDLPGCKVFIMQ